MFENYNTNLFLKHKILLKYNTISDLKIYHITLYLLLFQSRFGTKLIQLPLNLNF